MIIIPSTVAKIITCSAICSHYTFQEVSVQILFHCKQFVAVIFVVYKKPSWIIIKLPAIKIWLIFHLHVALHLLYKSLAVVYRSSVNH